jgi:hypothetical protein
MRRGPSQLDDSVVADMALVADVDVPEQGSVLIRTDTESGGWRGVVVANVDPQSKAETRMITIRTWLPRCLRPACPIRPRSRRTARVVGATIGSTG